MRKQFKSFRYSSAGGFTLIEVMVALIIGTLIVGGVMGLISASLRFTQKVNDRSQILPVLEAAAEMILANPQEAGQASLNMSDFAEGAVVDVNIVKAFEKEGEGLGTDKGQLYRVQLSSRGHLLEFSLIIPQQEK
jgi:prepilin-type N-terminal cleavage/methylation domain-containing protein